MAKLITLLSRVTGQRDNSKYKKIFIGFIAAIEQGRAIRWGRVISDTLWYQLAYFGSKLFYMNSYMVYLLLHGKVQSKQLADERYLGKKEFPIWCSYPKWWYYKVRHFYERNDLWEYEIYKDIKWESVMKRISYVAIQAIRVHADFYLQYVDYTYIKVYGCEEQPLLLPKYASDRLVLMEFAKQLLFLKERVWR